MGRIIVKYLSRRRVQLGRRDHEALDSLDRMRLNQKYDIISAFITILCSVKENVALKRIMLRYIVHL